jgi:hypothetical protein
MSWDLIPKTDGMRAGDNWLADLEPEKEEKKRKRLAEFQRKIEAALAPDKALLKMFEATLEMTHYTGRVDGLREGLELYEYALRIQDKKTAAFRAMMKYMVNNPKKVTPEAVCAHLDREIDRIKAQKTAEVSIGPPEAWGCSTWTIACDTKRNDLNALFYDAKKEAQSERYCTLMAWKTWGREKQKKVRAGKPKEQLDRPEPL